MPSCFICKHAFNLNSHLITHLNIFHDPKSLTEFNCVEPNCYRIFSTLHSYRNHLTKHTNLSDTHNVPGNLPSTNDVHTIPILDTINSSNLNNIIPSSSNYNPRSITINKFIDTLHFSSVTLASKWYNNSVLPRKIIQVLFDDIQEFNNSFLFLLKEKLQEIIRQNDIDSSHFNDILHMFDTLVNPFSNINSEHLRFKIFDEMGILIRPRSIDIGCRLNDRMKAGRVIFEPKISHMYFIPLRSVLKIVLQDCNLFEVIIKFISHLESKSEKCISNFFQSQLWQRKLKENPQKILFPLFLYFDDFEINNALGSHAGNNKLGAVYASLPCLPSEYSSSLENIFLVSLFKSVDRQEFGNHAIFSEIITA